MDVLPKVKEWREGMQELSRKELAELIKEQDEQNDTELARHARRIEWVFANKLSHLTWRDGEPVTERPLTKEEMVLLLDPPFIVDEELLEHGINEDAQRRIQRMSDPVIWAREILGENPRAYQVIMLRDPNKRKLMRLGRRSGKSWTLAVSMLHSAYINKNARVLVLAPFKSQVGLLYKECLNKMKDTLVENAKSRAVASPHHEIEFHNGSTIKFFTTGSASGSKSDVARGQEASLIVLDEMDYMGPDDLDAIYVMLTPTDENQAEKELIAASTPTGRKEKFWEWAGNPRFKEFWFPSYVMPTWNKEMEEEFREEYDEMGYRHEIEADWGEDAEGVYPQRYVSRARKFDWEYEDRRIHPSAVYLMGVDWDKYAAGPNIVVLEVIPPNTDLGDAQVLAGKLRVVHREEIPKDEYRLLSAVDRIKELNQRFQPKHIYVDRGYGDTQAELLMKAGVEDPATKLRERVVGIHSSETVDVRDPATREMRKKRMKHFMVDSLRNLLEEGAFFFPESDEELHKQLISYIVKRTTQNGMPVFTMSGKTLDHAHDALLLAVLAYVKNYDSLLASAYVTRAATFKSNTLNKHVPDREEEEGDTEKTSPYVVSISRDDDNGRFQKTPGKTMRSSRRLRVRGKRNSRTRGLR